MLDFLLYFIYEEGELRQLGEKSTDIMRSNHLVKLLENAEHCPRDVGLNREQTVCARDESTPTGHPMSNHVTQ